MVSCKAANNVELGSYWQKVVRIGPTPKYEGAILDWLPFPGQIR